MKVTYQTCCGVDVHKSFLVATIIKTTAGIEPSYQKKRFSTFNNSILDFKSWLLENECHDVCMESTGKYWVPVFNLLEDQINVTIANPKWVKAVKGNKDDTKDSKWIGDLFRLGLVKSSYIPCRLIRILREYTRYRYKLVSCRSSEKNRYDIRMLLLFVMSPWILLYPISLGSHPHPLSIICLNNQVLRLTTKKSLQNFLRASNPKKTL